MAETRRPMFAEIDNGELFRGEFKIVPGRDGSFVVMNYRPQDYGLTDAWGFTGVGDLMRFLGRHADAFAAYPMGKGQAAGIVESKS